MPTNDERKQIAARLRDVADCEHISDAADFGMAIKRTFREMVPIPRSDRAFLRTIAETIEPEPERTVNLTEAVDAICGQMCGDGWDWSMRAETVVKTVAEMCGAKVVR